MVQGRQSNLRVFEFEPCDEKTLMEYIERNQILLKGFLILLAQEISDSLMKFLKEKELVFMESQAFSSLRKNHRQSPSLPQKPSHQEKLPQPKNNESSENYGDNSDNGDDIVARKSLFLNRIIRSGEEIECEGDVVIYGRVNSGARIYAKGNVQIYGEIDGVVESEGDFMIITKIEHGSVLFGGEFLDPTLFNGEKTIIFKDNTKQTIKEI